MADEIQPPDGSTLLAVPPADAAAPPLPTAVRFDRVDRNSFAITAIIAFAGYWFTLSQEVTLEWSGMLSTSAYYAGVGPPPGYPVWTFYSWLFAHLIPFSNIAWRIAIGSAVASAAACGLASLLISYGGRVLCNSLTTFSTLELRMQDWLRRGCGGAAGLVLAFSSTVWDQAVIVEVRGLSLLLWAGLLCLLMRWFFDPARKRFVCGAFLLFGMLLTNSQDMIVALPGLVCAIMLGNTKLGRDVALSVLPLVVLSTIPSQYNALWTVFLKEMNWPMLGAVVVVVLAAIALTVKTRRVGTEWKAALFCGFAFSAGLAFYFYEPIASMTNPPVNWAYPRTVEGFSHLISRGQYNKVIPTGDFFSYLGQLQILWLMVGKSFGWLYLVFAALPFFFLRRFDSVGRRWLFAMLAVFLSVSLLLLALLNPPPDRGARELIELYFGPAYLVLAVWLGLGLMMVGAKLTKPGGKLAS